MKFYYVYKALAHPEMDGLVQPLTLEERLLHVKEAQRRLNTEWTWLADAPDNQVKAAFGNRNNSEFVIDPEGNIVRARDWSDEEELREDLSAFVGAVETRTVIADLAKAQDLPSDRDEEIARNVLPRIPMPEGAKALKVTSTSAEGVPLYVKLRADSEPDLMRKGTGSVRLGFWLDPIHRVHWNNLAPPLTFRFLPEEGAETGFEPASASAPAVEVEADYDPREFLVEIQNADLSRPLRIEVSYFPCHDVEKWCRATTQEFQISWEEDRNAGRPRSEMAGRKGDKRPSRGPDPAQLMSRFDTDNDGKIAKAEAVGKLADRFAEMDRDQDGFITEAEMKARFDRR